MKKTALFLLIALVLLVSCNQDEVHVHKFDEGTVTTAPTCTTEGVKTFKCQCGETKTEEVSALGHDKVEVEAKEATCTEKGWKAYEKCKREGCDYTTYEEIATTGHSYGELKTTAATCEKDGEEYKVCSVCNYKNVKKTLTKLDHDFKGTETVVQQATCTEKGSKTIKCTRCEKTTTEEVPATGHTEGTPVTTAATCTAAGSTVVKCTVCNTVISTASIPQLAHDLENSSTIAATCINKAVVTYKCKNCDYTENREEGEVDSTNHTGDTEWVLTTEAKFFTKGVETKKCKSCNALLTETRETDFKDPTGLWMTTGNDVLSFASGKLTLGAIQSGYYVEFGPYTYKIEDDKLSYSSDSTHWISVDILGETADTMSLKIDGETKTFTRKTTTAHVHTYKTEKWACEDIVDKDGYIEMSLHSRVTNCENHDELKLVDFYTSHSYENGKCKICDCDERFEINIKSGTSFTIYLATNKAGFKLPGESTVTYTLGDTTTTYHGGDTYTPTGKILITDAAYADVSASYKAEYSAILSTYVQQ